VVIEFIEWLRNYNENNRKELKDKVGVFGMDIYSIFESIDEVLNYLENIVLDEQGYNLAKINFSQILKYRENIDEYRRK
jgi:erythromycin esterase-like protein